VESQPIGEKVMHLDDIVKRFLHTNEVSLKYELVEETEDFTVFRIQLNPLLEETAPKRWEYCVYIPSLDAFYCEETADDAIRLGQKMSKVEIICPNDIYNAPVLSSRTALWTLTDGWHRHLEELPDGFLDDIEQDQVLLKIHVDEDLDGERCIQIGSVWFQDHPVMIYRHAGRGGHDQYGRFITDPVRFEQMISYLRSLKQQVEPEYNVYDPNEPSLDLTYFYGVYWNF
jgi:hypothetical protein